MKTTENISIGGYAFTIETGAYNELKTYLEEISKAFSADPSAEEIIADIEERIAELLKEQTVPGMVISSAMIQGIMKRIGNPKELARDDAEAVAEQSKPDEEEDSKKSEKKGLRSRTIYRDMDKRIFGGVCSGLGVYLGIDKVLIRLIFMITFLLGLIGIEDGPFVLISLGAYICLWIAMPAARTDEQKREMRGRPTDLKGYKKKGFEFEKEMKDAAHSPGGRTVRRAGGVFLGILLLMIGLGGLLGGIFIPSIPEIISNEALETTMRWGALDAEEQLAADILGGTTFWCLVLVTLGIGCAGIIYGAILLLFDLKSPSWRPGLILFIAWIISIFVIIGWSAIKIADALPALL